VRDYDLHPYKTTVKITFLRFYAVDWKTKDSELNGSKHCPKPQYLQIQLYNEQDYSNQIMIK
jgi:hypothetical protein